MQRRGFTLIELLTVISIIGLLATVATVNYSSSRVKGRDGKRIADMDAVRQALEIYSISNDSYPADGQKDESGLVLGGPDSGVLTDGGWSRSEGLTYMARVPANPGPWGADYRYVSLNRDGSHCDAAPCAAFRLEFFLETDLAGLEAGPFVTSPEGIHPATGEVAQQIVASATIAPESQFVARTGQVGRAVNAAAAVTVNNPNFQRATEVVAAPVATVAVVATTATAVSAAHIGSYLYLIFTQPFLLLRRKKGFSWGIVYNSQTKLPLDLAIVRLIDEASNRVSQTRVTDQAGRVFFFATKGTYHLEVRKPDFDFPSKALVGSKEDGKFANLYLGGRIVVPESGAAINPSIPLDPSGAEAPDARVLGNFLKRQARHAVALSGFFISLGSFAVARKPWMIGLVVLHVALYTFFRRLSVPKQPAQWGAVTDEQTTRAVTHAVVRLFSLPYHKLVETKVTDRHGRYNFLVGANNYFLTVSHPNYWKTESFPLDLRSVDHPQVIAAHLSLRPLTLPPTAEAAAVDPVRDGT